MIRFALPAALVTALAAPAATSQPPSPRTEKTIEAALEGMIPGQPVSCIPRRGMGSVKSYGSELLYVQGRNRAWRNGMGGTCSGIDRDDVLVFRSPSDAYCSGDIVEARSRTTGFYSGSCVLGAFVPYSK